MHSWFMVRLHGELQPPCRWETFVLSDLADAAEGQVGVQGEAERGLGWFSQELCCPLAVPDASTGRRNAAGGALGSSYGDWRAPEACEGRPW